MGGGSEHCRGRAAVRPGAHLGAQVPGGDGRHPRGCPGRMRSLAAGTRRLICWREWGGRRDVTREAEPRPEPERGHHVPHGCILPHEALRAAGSPSRRGLSVTARAPGAADGLGAGPRSTSCTLCGPRPCCASSRVLHSSALLREVAATPAGAPVARPPRAPAWRPNRSFCKFVFTSC